MKNIAQFTTAEGRAIGIPAMGGLLVMGVVITALPGQPKEAKTLVRYMVGGDQGARIVWLRDPYKHVVSKLPISACGPWAHMIEKDGNEIALPQKSVGAYEETGDNEIRATLGIPSGPVDVYLRATLDDLIAIGALELEGEDEWPDTEGASQEEQVTLGQAPSRGKSKTEK